MKLAFIGYNCYVILLRKYISQAEGSWKYLSWIPQDRFKFWENSYWQQMVYKKIKDNTLSLHMCLLRKVSFYIATERECYCLTVHSNVRMSCTYTGGVSKSSFICLKRAFCISNCYTAHLKIFEGLNKIDRQNTTQKVTSK